MVNGADVVVENISRSIWETLNVSCLLDAHTEHQVSTVYMEYLDALEYWSSGEMSRQET